MENIQRILKKYSKTIQKNIQRIFSQSLHQLSVENIQRILKKYSKTIQRIFSQSVHQLSVENIQRMERKGRSSSWKIDRFLNCQLSNFQPCTSRKDRNPTKPPY